MGLFDWIMGDEPNPISQMLNYENSGQFGEYLTEYVLSKADGYNRILNNLYIPTSYGKTTEIDLVMVHEKGIFVFESKNYSGWIFGRAENKYWTQCLPNKEKYRFYNPILQNRTHINALSRILKIDKSNFMSFIIFSKRCELKKIPNNTPEYMIIKRNDLRCKLKNITNSYGTKNKFEKKQIDKIADELKKFTNVSKEIKEKHIEDIEKIRSNK